MADESKGLVAGVVLGFAVSCVLVGGGGVFLVQKKYRDVRAGWNLVPVVVAAVDIPEGTPVTFDMISQRSVPEQFVTASVVKPDSASYVINQRARAPLQAGDPLLWSMFEEGWVVAARDVPAGKPLAPGDVEEKGVQRGKEAETRSYVRWEDRGKLDGRAVLTPFKKGEPILIGHLAP